MLALPTLHEIYFDEWCNDRCGSLHLWLFVICYQYTHTKHEESRSGIERSRARKSPESEGQEGSYLSVPPKSGYETLYVSWNIHTIRNRIRRAILHKWAGSVV